MFIVHVSVVIERAGKLLLVQEHSGHWNLPGGHLEEGERLVAGAAREAREETGLEVEVDGLLGIYTGFGADHLLNFAFHALAVRAGDEARKAGAGTRPAPTGGAPPPDVARLRWFTPQAALALPAAHVLNPRKLRRILTARLEGRTLPLDAIAEDVYGSPTHPEWHES